MKDLPFKKEFEDWKDENGQHGRQAFSRYMMLKFLDGINEVSDEFVFKGGNLLWHYIKTPRQTTDLDLTTLSLRSHNEVREILQKVQNFYQDIEFKIVEFNEIKKSNILGASVIIFFETNQGQKNQFKIDIVYTLPTDLAKVKSTISKQEYISASIENIIADKLQSANKFKSGNTRMKDFDDLWRIANSKLPIKYKTLNKLLIEKEVQPSLKLEWTDYLTDAWKRHAKSYRDIPTNIEDVFGKINSWLEDLEDN